MSAFVVSRSCMDLVVQGLRARTQFGQVIRVFAGIITEDNAGAHEIGRKLFAMNIDAVRARYPDTSNDPSNMPGWDGCHMMPQTYTFRPPINGSLVICLKELHCLHYQCSEGNVPDSELYRELDHASGLIANAIVRGLPSYDKAPWG